MLELFEAGKREGVPIAPILDIEDFYNSPQTRAREYFVKVEHPIAGAAEYPGPPYKWTESPPEISRPAPCLGEHNLEVYCDGLGFTREEVLALRAAGVV